MGRIPGLSSFFPAILGMQTRGKVNFLKERGIADCGNAQNRNARPTWLIDHYDQNSV